VGGTCSTREDVQKCVECRLFFGKLEGSYHLGDLGADGKIILKLIV
jgi:hypothetical protein